MFEIFIITTISLILCLIIILKAKTMLQQIFGLFAVMGTAFYSGFGISLESVSDKYLISFIIFITVFTISFLIIKPKKSKNTQSFIDLNSKSLGFLNLTKVAKVGFWIYLLISFIYLVYPENRLILLISPPKMDVHGIGLVNSNFKSNRVLYFLGNIQILLIPFYFINLFNLWKSKRRVLVLLIILLDLYLTALKVNYIGRTDIVITLLLILLIMTYNNNFKIKFKTGIKILLVVLISVPFLMEYVYIRAGISSNIADFKSLFTQFISSESYYPIYYDTILNSHIPVTVKDYIIWLITLPIPKVFLPSLNIVEINYAFTYAISGLSINDPNFSYFLPSILGESFLIWGGYFYWIHAVILGVITGLVCKLLEKFPQLHFFAFYLSLRTFAFGRGGSQGYISTIINDSLLFIFYLFIIWLIQSKRRHT